MRFLGNLIITLLAAVSLAPLAQAQFSGANPCIGSNAGSQQCTSAYYACVNAGASASNCYAEAAQYNAAMSQNDSCVANNGANCNNILMVATQALNNLNSLTQNAIDAQISNQVGAPNSPPPVNLNTSGGGNINTNCGTNCNLSYTPLEPLPGEPVVNGNYQADLSTYISQGFNLLVILGGFIAVLLIVWGGITYMGSEVSAANKARAKERIRGAVLGLLLLLASWLILHTINPRLTQFNTLFNPVGQSISAPITGGTTGGTGTGGTQQGTGPGSAQDTACQSQGALCALTPSQNGGGWSCFCG